MPNRYYKYSYSERRKRGSEGLRGEVYIPPKASDEDKKNFQHWLTNKIYEYAGLSQTARLIISNYIESNWRDLKIVAPDLLAPEQHFLRFVNEGMMNSEGSGRQRTSRTLIKKPVLFSEWSGSS